MKKILFVITKSDVGGAQKWVNEQIQICAPYFDCFIATNKPGWLTSKHDATKIFTDVKIESRISIFYLINLVRWVKSNNIDIVVASSANAGIYARICNLVLRLRLKTVYVSHGWSAIYNGGKLKSVYQIIERILSFITDKVLCVSENDFNTAIKDIRINPKRLVLLQNSIFPIPGDKNSKRGLKKKILSVGRFIKPKRFDILIEAAKFFNFELHLIGSGPLYNEFIKDAPKNVFFHDEVKDFQNFSDYDVFCLISDSEGLPLSAIEAMSCGLPLVLSNVGGCSELIRENGFLVDNSPEEIANKLKISIANKDIFGDNSKKIYEERFNLNSKRNEYIEFYSKI